MSVVARRGVIGAWIGLALLLVASGCGASSGGSSASGAATKVVTHAIGSATADQALATTSTPTPATPATSATPAPAPAPTTATTVRPHATPVVPAETTTAPVAATSSTTAPPATTTTTRPVTVVTVLWATVSITNQFGSPVDVNLNGVHYQLTPGQSLLEQHVTPAPSGNDVIELTDLDHPSCGVGDAQGYFVANLWYQLNIVTAKYTCTGVGPGPDFQLQQALAKTG
ncbi:MAG: hypothetical protein ACRDZ8_02830 [Acidimicrobiales bacterium]